MSVFMFDSDCLIIKDLNRIIQEDKSDIAHCFEYGVYL